MIKWNKVNQVRNIIDTKMSDNDSRINENLENDRFTNQQICRSRKRKMPTVLAIATFRILDLVLWTTNVHYSSKMIGDNSIATNAHLPVLDYSFI